MRRLSREQVFGLLPYILSAVGIIFSIVSMTDLCSSACSEAHMYRFYDIEFGWVGICTFVGLAALWRFRNNRFSRGVYTWVLVSSCGAEAWFLFVQKAVIRSWCPVCVALAVTVGLLASIVFINFILKLKITIKEQKMRRVIITSVLKSVFVVVGALFGFGIAFFGVEKPAEAQVATDLWLGKANSAVEVYVITDWFCPGCRKAEPEIEAATKAINNRAKVAFVDYSVHPESTNFSPYNLSFQIYNKAQYLPLRSALINLAQKTKTPTTEEVQEAIKATGVKYKQLPMSDVMAGMAAYTAVISKFGATVTPTVIIRSVKSGKMKKLEGHKDIKASSIVDAVAEASRN